MIGILVKNTTRTVTSAATVLAIASLASRLLGMFRDRLLSGTFGAGMELDAYYAAFRAPDFMYNLFVLGAISAGFIPVFSRYVNTGRDERTIGLAASGLASRVISLLGIALAAVSVIGAVAAPIFVPALTPGFVGDQTALTVNLTRLMFLSPIFLGLSSVFGGMLQTYRKFLVYALAPVFYNLGIIFGVLFLSGVAGIAGAAIGVVVGSFMHFLIQLLACRKIGFRFRFRPDLRHEGVTAIGKMMIPRTAGLAVNQVNLLIITGIASTLGAGSIAVFNLANNLQSFPVGILGISFAIAAFPLVSELAAEGRTEELVGEFVKTVRTILYLVIPATVAFLLLRAQIVRVVLGSGAFDWGDTIGTADTLAFFVLSLFAQAMIPLIIRVFFAFHDVVTPLLTSAAAVLIERVIAWRLIALGMGAPGLALAFSIGSAVNIILLWMVLRHRLGPLKEKAIFRSLLTMCGAAVVMVLTVQGMKVTMAGIVDMQTFWGVLTQGAVAGTVGLLTYFVISLIMGSEEAIHVVSFYRRRVATVPVTDVVQEEETFNVE